MADLKNSVVDARSCQVIRIEYKVALDFIDKSHRQENLLAKRLIAYGLYYSQELVGIALFGSPRGAQKKKQYTKELLFLTLSKEISVRGGASKLISFFIEDKNPIDFFTYQDTTAKTTDVYEQAGMNFVSQSKQKQFLVAPGKTVKTGSSSEVLGKSNREIFLEDLAQNIEETSRDRIYEWINPRTSFYVYKISSTRDDSYYIGRRTLFLANATESDCLEDEYMGSGGQKFQNWTKKVGRESLTKEILKITSSWKEIVFAESKLISDKYSTDARCKNSRPGGVGYSAISWKDHLHTATCAVHGKTMFFSKICCKCRNQKTITIKECSIHGRTSHQGKSCRKCTVINSISIQKCVLHGPTKFIGQTCYKCSIDKQWATQECSIHGLTLFQSNVCKKCSSQDSFVVDVCPTHGVTKFRGKLCYKCHNISFRHFDECKMHGLTKFKGNICCKCSSSKKDHMGHCSVHGRTMFQYSRCQKCVKQKRDQLRECPIHGVTKHRGTSCYHCTIEKANTTKDCMVHGLTKFRGNSCCKCSTVKANHSRYHASKGKVDKNCLHCNGLSFG
jgi:hypothetical protein